MPLRSQNEAEISCTARGKRRAAIKTQPIDPVSIGSCIANATGEALHVAAPQTTCGDLLIENRIGHRLQVNHSRDDAKNEQ